MNVTRTSDKLYMQCPPPFKKNPTNVHIHTCIHTHTHTPHTHMAHAHTPPQHCAPAVTLSNSSVSPLCSPLPSRLLQLDEILCSYDMRKKCSAWLPPLPGRGPVCLFIFLSPWEKLQSPKVLQHQGRASLPHCRHPAAPWPAPPPRPWDWEAAASPGQHEEGNTHSHSPTHSNNKITLQHKGIVSVTR